MTGHELILGGAKSGKSRTAERRAADWLAACTDHRASLIATALPGELTGDSEMAQRIARHRADRAAQHPGLATVEAPCELGATLRRLDDPAHLLVVDCLTLWLTQCLMPPPLASEAGERWPRLRAPAPWPEERDALLSALVAARSPIVLVSNEIGLGVMPMSPEARAFVDALGILHQAVAAHCARVTLMVAGLEMPVRGGR